MKKVLFTLVALILAIGLALPMATPALADLQQVDNDIYSPGLQHVVNLSAEAAATVNTSAQIIVTRSGGNHLSVGDPLTFTDNTSYTNLPVGYTVSDVSGTVPSPWDTNGLEYAVWSDISFTAPATLGSYTYHVKWDETHNYGNKLTGGDNFVIKLEVTEGGGGEPAEVASLAITKTADVFETYEGETITYTYLVENTGNVNLSAPTVTDSLGITVSAVLNGNTYNIGDTGNDNVFGVGEIWEFTAQYTVPWFTAGPVLNTGNATALYGSSEIWDTDDESVTILHNPGIGVTKEGPAPIGYFESVDATYTYTVTNTGDCALIVTLEDDVYGVLQPSPGGDYLLPDETWYYEVTDTLVCTGDTTTMFSNKAIGYGTDAEDTVVMDCACWNVVVFQWMPRSKGYWGNWDNHWSSTCMTQFVNAVNSNSAYFYGTGQPVQGQLLTVNKVHDLLLAPDDQKGKMDKTKATALLRKQLLATWLSVVSYMQATDGNSSTCGSLDAAMDPNATVYFETGGSMTVRALLNRIEYNLTTGAATFGVDGRLLAKDILDKMNNTENNAYCMFMDPEFDPSACQGHDLRGDWLINVNSGAYLHDMTITDQACNGDLTGTGGYPASGPPYESGYDWTLTGQVTGSSVTLTLLYTNGYTATITGTVASDGDSMSGGVGTGGVVDWTATR